MSINVTGKTTTGKEVPIRVDANGVVATSGGGSGGGGGDASAANQTSQITQETATKVAVQDLVTNGVGQKGSWTVAVSSLVLSAGSAVIGAVTQSGSWILSAGTAYIGKVRPTDGTNDATIKAASTAAIGSDTAIVVAVSPNNTIASTQSGTWNIGTITTLPSLVLSAGAAVIGAVTQSGSWILSAGSAIIGKVGIDQTTPGTTNAVQLTKTTLATDTVLQNAVSATGNGSSLDVAGFTTCTLEVTGTFVATVTFEASKDDSVWYAISCTYIGSTVISTSTTTTGLYRISVGGVKSIRARVTWTSGTSITIKGAATIADAPTKLVNSLLPYTIAGEDIPNDVLKVESRYSFANITTQTTTVVKTGAGLLKRIVFGKSLASGVVAIYDNTAGSGTLISTITFPAVLLSDVNYYDFECAVATGITVVTSGATQDITVIYR